MAFEKLINNQKKVIRLLHNSAKRNRLVHTYLFEGEKGVGKLDAAYYLAALILCNEENAPCLKCSNCLKVINKTHQNLFFIEPEKEVIKREQIDELEHEFSMTALGLDKRVFIIKDIDKTNLTSANSLLKFLEETNPNNYGILLTEYMAGVLPTIKSRSQIITFSKLPKEVIVEELIGQGINENMSLILASITNSVIDAKELIQDGKILDIIELVKVISINMETKEKETLLLFYEKGKFLIDENNRKYHNIFMDLLITATNDKLYYVIDQVGQITFKDETKIIASFLDKRYVQTVKKIECLLNYKRKLNYNINLELMYYQMFIELKGE